MKDGVDKLVLPTSYDVVLKGAGMLRVVSAALHRTSLVVVQPLLHCSH